CDDPTQMGAGVCFSDVVDCCDCECSPVVPTGTNLVLNGGFENGTPGFPNAFDQIDQCSNWYPTTTFNITGIGDWYSTSTPFFPGYFNDVPNMQNTVLPAACGSKYAGIDLSTCEGISTQFTSPISNGDTYLISFCWTPQEPVTSNFDFFAIMSGGNCTVYEGGGECGHSCSPGDFHIPVQVNPTHVPGTWYTHTATGIAGMTVDYLTFTSSWDQAPINNLIYIDGVFVDNTSDICCTDSIGFFNTAANVQTFGTLGDCTIQFNAIGLDSCMQISYDWGDCPPASDGPFGNNASVSHTYSGSGTYTVCHTIEEVDSNGDVCWEYEFCQDILVLCDSFCPTDLNMDGVTDGDDFGVFLGNFGVPCADPCGCPTDLNGDGITDGDDFGIFLGNFGLPCPTP
ncbi:MAG: hypothetical protein ACI9EV_002803, partial [Urechidicola sp.]